MQGSDDALDAVDTFASAMNKLDMKPQAIRVFLARVARQAGPVGVLGVADSLWMHGLDLRQVGSFIKPFVQKELSPRMLAE